MEPRMVKSTLDNVIGKRWDDMMIVSSERITFRTVR